MMHLSRHVGPKYLEVAATLRFELEACTAGDCLPAERLLAQRFEINRHTLRRALDVLVAEGRVVRRQGVGTIVLPKPLVYPLHSRSAFSNVAARMGSASEARLLRRIKRRANRDEITHLALDADAWVIELLTVRVLDDQPASLIAQSFSANHEPLLTAYAGGSVREHLEGHGITLSRVFSVIGASLPSQREAVQLLMPQHAPVLKVQTLSSDSSGAPFELAWTTSRADRFQFLVVSEGDLTDDF
ncbi:MAG TPA: GntR family transcriptional regulator [Eoetvoesiella sp.]